MAKEIKVIFKAPGEDPEVRVVEHTLEKMQEMVGGYIDRVNIDSKYDLWVNDEGLLLNLPPNLRFPESGTVIVGPVYVAGYTPAGNTVSVADKDIAKITSWLKNYAIMHL